MRIAAFLSTALLAAPVAAQSETTPYRALGTEPFWNLAIDGQTMRLEEAGRATVVVPRPAARPSFNGTRYVGSQLTVDVTRSQCNDGMSDRSYPDTVTIQIGKRMLNGCGDVAAMRSRLADTRWTVDTVNGRRLRATPPLTVNFASDRVDGRLCNRFGGRYVLTGETLRVDDVIAMGMACQGAPQVAESTLFRMWRGSVQATFSRRGTLVLAGHGSKVTLRPAR